MKNPIRRNRNIGTAKQGHGANNKLVIPWPAAVMKSFKERLTKYTKVNRTIIGNRFEFVIEQNREGSIHACTVNDCAEILRHIVPSDYGRLNLVIFRQPKRKEEILNSVWGRLIYSYEFEGDYRPAIILEAIDPTKILKWPKSLTPGGQKELERLRLDGHNVVSTKRDHQIHCDQNSIRATQLYRTLPHEIGHYKHYLELLGEIGDIPETGTDEEFDKRLDIHNREFENYFKLSTDVKEKFAHNFADKFKSKMTKVGVIPFERIESE